ncbi:protein split ends-like [Acyrthosiphon pisum]|uniref:RRM domain-containing protein n=1 Tax=Acyrthosiphon pisum TaxID=7029 RepID=A0A8R2JUF8_ACYPI|nr:protein split ends-like [Acyrthosiphon pisum]
MENYGLNEIDKFGFITNLSRTLYIGNLKENIDDDTLFRYFGEFGQIISINIKRVEYVGGRPNIYAFIKYFDSNNVIIAILKMNGVNIEGCRISLGFGKTYPSKCVWITGINELGDNNNLLQIFVTEFGSIENYLIDRINKRALIYFKEFVDSEAAINKMKNRLINGLYLRSDYASIECQKKFAEFFHRPNDNIYLSTPLNNVHIQNTSISNVNRQMPAVSHVETDSTSIASKEITSEIILIYSIWVNGIADSVTNEYLESHFSQFGPIQKCLIDRSNKCALLCFQEESHAKYAAFVMNGSYLENEKIHVHLASKSASDVPNINNDNETIQLKDNMAQSSPYNTRHVDLSGKSAINDETDPINIIYLNEYHLPTSTPTLNTIRNN